MALLSASKGRSTCARSSGSGIASALLSPSRELPVGVRLDGREVAHDDRGERPREAAVGHRPIVGTPSKRHASLSLWSQSVRNASDGPVRAAK